MFVNFLVWLLELITKQKWGPIISDPPDDGEPPEGFDYIPDWVENFGDLNRYQPLYSREATKLFLRVISLKASVFFSDPKATYEVKRPDGSTALKHVFSARTNDGQPTLLNVPNGSLIVAYLHLVPNTTKVWSPGYADGNSMYEICEPLGGVVKLEDVEVEGRIVDGWWKAGDK